MREISGGHPATRGAKWQSMPQSPQIYDDISDTSLKQHKAKLLYHVATGRIFTSRQVKRCRALSNGFLRQYTTHICMCTICTMKVSPLITSLMFRAWIVLAGAWFGKSPSQSHIVFLRGRKAPSYYFSTEKVKMLKEDFTKVMITV